MNPSFLTLSFPYIYHLLFRIITLCKIDETIILQILSIL